ncbi:hypothetical protein F4X33_12165, partial [Candidatus Poribacteria bacterium]|nr:hypothetical protein [Candidatus Poribacteria bacterium]
MEVGTNIKIIIGIIVILAFGFITGFIAFEVLTDQSSNIEEKKQTVAPDARRITTPRFVKPSPRTAAKTQQEETNIESLDTEASPVPERVPTAQSSDDEIKEFAAWLSLSLEREDTVEEIEQEDFNTENDAEDNQIDYPQERARVESVIWEQWKDGLESRNIERYMSGIWGGDFFYISDLGTPNNPDDDIVFRGGYEEREGTSKMFDRMESIDLNLSQHGDVDFLNEKLAMVDFDYEMTLVQGDSGEVSYPSGRMIFILELREDEW